MPRSIVHLDADSFYASVEQASDQRLRGLPVAVGGEARRMLASVSPEAAALGVRAAMPTATARKLCPKLVVLPGDFEKYEQFSAWMFACVTDFTPLVEVTNLDAGYFDVSGALLPPPELAHKVRGIIARSLKISIMEGIASNKLVSHITSRLRSASPLRIVPAGGEAHFLHPLPNRWLPGIGAAEALRLNAAGLARIGNVSATPLLRYSAGVAGTVAGGASGEDQELCPRD